MVTPVEKTAVEISAHVCDDDWAATVAGQCFDLLEKDLWSEVRSRKKAGCLPLAKAARKLLEAKSQAHELMADFFIGKPKAYEFHRCFSEILRDPIKKIPIPGEEVLSTAAHALRITGIYLCTISGDLKNCPCLDDLAEDVGKDNLEENLAAGLEKWE